MSFKIDVKRTVAEHGQDAEFNGKPARFVVISDEASFEPAGQAQGRKADSSDVVLTYENDEGQRRGAIMPLTNIDGDLKIVLKDDDLGYEHKLKLGGNGVRNTIGNIGALYGILAHANQVLRETPDFEDKAREAAAGPDQRDDVVEPLRDDVMIALLEQIRDNVGRNAENFRVEAARNERSPGLSAAHRDVVTLMIHQAEAGLDKVIESPRLDPSETSAIFDHRARLNLVPEAKLTAQDVSAVREVREIRERIAAIDPENENGQIYTHVVPVPENDPEEVREALNATRDFAKNDLKLFPNPGPLHRAAASASSVSTDMLRETMARWTSLPTHDALSNAFPISGDQRRSLVALLRNSEVEDSPNKAAVQAFRDAVQPEYKPEETVFKAGGNVVLLVDDPHGASSVYLWPEAYEAQIDNAKPAFVPYDRSEILDAEGIAALRTVLAEVQRTDDRDIDMAF